MSLRSVSSAAVAACAFAALAFVPAIDAQSGAPKTPDIPRMTNGKPDFNGIWDHPRVADVTKDGKGCGSQTSGCVQKGSGALAFTEAGLAEWKNENRFDYSGHCLPWGYTRAWQVEYPVEIVQTPKRIALLFESNNIFHVISTDGREHPKDLEPSWMGNSTGKWDGDTLVVDSIGFNGKTWIDTIEHPSSDALHVVEHIRPIDANHLAYDVTWEDSKMYSKPITNTRVMTRMKPGDELMEYWCMENNRDLPHLSR